MSHNRNIVQNLQLLGEGSDMVSIGDGEDPNPRKNLDMEYLNKVVIPRSFVDSAREYLHAQKAKIPRKKRSKVKKMVVDIGRLMQEFESIEHLNSHIESIGHLNSHIEYSEWAAWTSRQASDEPKFVKKENSKASLVKMGQSEMDVGQVLHQEYNTEETGDSESDELEQEYNTETGDSEYDELEQEYNTDETGDSESDDLEQECNTEEMGDSESDELEQEQEKKQGCGTKIYYPTEEYQSKFVFCLVIKGCS